MRFKYVVILAGLSAIAAMGQVTTFTSLSEWQAAAGSGSIEPFDASGLQPLTGVSTTSGSVGPATGLLTGSVWNDRVTVGGRESTTFRYLPANASAAGAQWDTSPGGEGQALIITISLASGGSVVVARIGPLDNGFFGWTSSVPFNSFTITAADSELGVAETYAMDDLRFVSVPPNTTCPAPTSGAYGVPYSAQLIGSGGSGSGYSWSLSAGSIAPLTLSPSGLISGTLTPPGGAGSLSFTVNVTDSSGAVGHQPCTLTVLPPIVSFACPANSANVGVPYSAQLVSLGGSGGGIWTVSAGSLAPFSLSTGGLISGAATAPGTLNFTLHLLDNIAGGNATQECNLTITNRAPATTCPAATATVGVAYSSQLVGSLGSGSGYVWSLASGSLSPLLLSGGGLVSGTPSAPGVLTFTLKITDSANATGQQPCTITVAFPLPRTTCPAVTANINILYSSQLVGSSGSGTGYSWTLADGSLSPLTLTTGGRISGTVTTTGVLSFTLKITDSVGGSSQTPCTITISANPITNCPAATASAGPYSSQLAGSGGTGTGYVWSLASGSLSPLTLSPAGLVSGTTTAAGVLNFTVKVMDSSGASGQTPCTITITVPLSANCPAATATSGAAYSSQLIGTGGSGTGYSWTLASGALAPLNLSPAGLVSGTPTAAGTLTFTLRITDSSTATATQACTIAVTGSITITPSITSPNQTTLATGFTQPAPSAFTGTLTLTFTPNPAFTGPKALPAGYVDPAAGFPVGGQCPTKLTCNFNIAQGGTQASTTFSQGTVAGTWTVTMTALSTGGTSALPSPAPTQTVAVALAAPVIDSNSTSVKIINVASTGFTVSLTGFVTSRDIISASFTFTPAAGADLTGTTVNLPFNGQDQTQWFATAAGQAAGGTFSLQVPFGFSGDPAAIGTVTVTLTGSAGTSAAVTGGV